MSPTKRKTAAAKKKPAAKNKPVANKKKPAGKTSAAKKVSKAKKTKVPTSRSTSSDFSNQYENPNVEVARELAAIAENHAVSELIYETDALTLTIRRGEGMAIGAQMMAPTSLAPAALAPMAPVQSAPTAAAEQANDDHLHSVTSPFVGTFYRAPNPDSPSYVEPGQHVEKGQALCIVEAMKLMNEIEADVSGTISAILVKNAESVEYGQPLFKIDPA